MEERQISKAVIKRLPRYYRYLGEILDSGMERISSGELSSRMKVTASQIRQAITRIALSVISSGSPGPTPTPYNLPSIINSPNLLFPFALHTIPPKLQNKYLLLFRQSHLLENVQDYIFLKMQSKVLTQ